MTTEPERTPDERLLGDLRRVLEAVDAMETGHNDAAKAAFGWTSVDAELADIIFDSAVDRPEVVLRTSSTELRHLTFQASAAEVTIEIEVGNSRLIGQIIPPQTARIQVTRVGGATHDIEADEFGVFQVRELEPGPTTVIARAADGSWSVQCAWTVT